VLGRHKVKGAEELVVAEGGTLEVTYAELAKVAALTILLHGPEESYGVSLPLDAWRDLVRVVVRDCPCDDGALAAAWSVVYVWDREINSGGLPRSERQEWKEILRGALARVLDEKRPMDFTRVGPALGLTEEGEFLYTYLFMIDDPRDKEFSELFQGLWRAEMRATKVLLPAGLRKTIDERIGEFREHRADWEKQMEEKDAMFNRLGEVEKEMWAFCDAVNRRDDAVVKAGIAEELLKKDGDLYEQILGKGFTRIGFDYVAVNYINSEYAVRVVRSGEAGAQGLFLMVPLDKEGGKWKVDHVWREPK
jgi:hypothetical protein